MHTRQLAIMVVLIVAFAASTASASVFAGFLTSADGGIVATPEWQTVTLGWTITGLADGTWRYNYDLWVSQGASQQKNISHFIVEASLGFTERADILWHNWGSAADDVEVLTWSSANGNPDIPGSLFGIKFNDPGTLPSTPQQSTGTHWYIQFDCTRAPVWGDFYAKDGKSNGVDLTAWNAGFLLADPTVPPADGSINNHILRPDTSDMTPEIPEAGAAMLASLGLLPLISFRLRRGTS